MRHRLYKSIFKEISVELKITRVIILIVLVHRATVKRVNLREIRKRNVKYFDTKKYFGVSVLF